MREKVKRFVSLLSAGLCSVFLFTSQGYGFLTDVLDKANRVINESEKLRQEVERTKRNVENLIKRGNGGQEVSVQGNQSGIGSPVLRVPTQPITHDSGKIILYFFHKRIPFCFYRTVSFSQFDPLFVIRLERDEKKFYLFNYKTGDVKEFKFGDYSSIWENHIRKKYYMYYVEDARDLHVDFHRPRAYILLDDALIASDDFFKSSTVLLDEKKAIEILKKYKKNVKSVTFSGIIKNAYFDVVYVRSSAFGEDEFFNVIFVTEDGGKTWEPFFYTTDNRKNLTCPPDKPNFFSFKDPFTFYIFSHLSRTENLVRHTLVLDKKTKTVMCTREVIPGIMELQRKWNTSEFLLYHDVTDTYVFETYHYRFVVYNAKTKEEMTSPSFNMGSFSSKPVFASKDGKTIVINAMFSKSPTKTHETDVGSFVSLNGGKNFSLLKGFHCMPVENKEHKVVCLYEGTIEQYYKELEEERKKN